MANNLIQIKRSVSSAITTSTPALQAGELAFTQSGNTLWIGAPDGTSGNIPIAGYRNPGVLTANQALVANATSGIDKVITTVIQTNVVTLPGAFPSGGNGTAGYVLTSNGNSNAYWQSLGTVGTDETAQYNWTNTHTFSANVTFNDKLVGNTVYAQQFGANVTGGGYGTVTGGALVNTTYIAIGNSTINGYLSTNATTAYFTGTAGNTAYVGVTAAVDVVNTAMLSGNLASYATTSSVTANASAAYSNAMADTLTRSGTYTGNNSFTGANTTISKTTFTANVITSNSTYMLFGNTDGGAFNSSGIVISSNLVSYPYNNTNHGGAFAIGIPGPNGPGGDAKFAPQGSVHAVGGNLFFVNTSILQIGNSTSYSNVNGGTITFNGAGSTSATINSTMYTGTVLTANNATYLGGSAAADFATYPGNGSFTGNNTFGGTNTVFTSNVVANQVAIATITSNIVFTSANIVAASANVSVKDLNVSGNLTVTGTLTSIDTTNLIVKDASVKLADQQASTATPTDAVDFAVYGAYGNTANAWFSGINRDHVDGIWKLFYSNTEPTSVVDTSAAGYRRGTLQAYLQPYGPAGAFVANATAVIITANSTVTANIIANNLTLSTALAGTSGGTGVATIANNAILVGNSTNGYNALSLGTAGYVLQSNGTALKYDVLDGGTF